MCNRNPTTPHPLSRNTPVTLRPGSVGRTVTGLTPPGPRLGDGELGRGGPDPTGDPLGHAEARLLSGSDPEALPQAATATGRAATPRGVGRPRREWTRPAEAQGHVPGEQRPREARGVSAGAGARRGGGGDPYPGPLGAPAQAPAPGSPDVDRRLGPSPPAGGREGGRAPRATAAAACRGSAEGGRTRGAHARPRTHTHAPAHIHTHTRAHTRAGPVAAAAGGRRLAAPVSVADAGDGRRAA